MRRRTPRYGERRLTRSASISLSKENFFSLNSSSPDSLVSLTTQVATMEKGLQNTPVHGSRHTFAITISQSVPIPQHAARVAVSIPQRAPWMNLKDTISSSTLITVEPLTKASIIARVAICHMHTRDISTASKHCDTGTASK